VSWVILLLSGIFEAVWASALARSDGFTRLAPSAIFCIALLMSMAGLATAMKDLPVGTSYAVWVGVGAVLTVAYAMLTGEEAASPAKIVLMLGIVACVIGLKVVSHLSPAFRRDGSFASMPTGTLRNHELDTRAARWD
jgi:quaternary ammonium compound-resistance protein SugE